MEYPTDEVVIDVEGDVHAPDEDTAQDGYRELTARTGAQITQVIQAPFESGHPDLFVVRLQKSDRLRPNETPIDGMTRVARAWYEMFDRTEEPSPDHPRRMAGLAFDDHSGDLVPIGSDVTIVVRMADIESPLDDREWLTWEFPEGFNQDFGPDFVQLWGTKTVLYTETVRWDLPTAEHELERSFAHIPHRVATGSPTVLATRHLRFRSLITVTDDPVADAYRAALSYLGDRTWTITQDTPTELRAEHTPHPPPSTGFLRWELQIVQVPDDDTAANGTLAR